MHHICKQNVDIHYKEIIKHNKYKDIMKLLKKNYILKLIVKIFKYKKNYRNCNYYGIIKIYPSFIDIILKSIFILHLLKI